MHRADRHQLERIAPHAEFNEISLAAIAACWMPQFRQWTIDAENLSPDDLARAKAIHEIVENRRLEAVQTLAPGQV
jgi:hypothetical protein